MHCGCKLVWWQPKEALLGLWAKAEVVEPAGGRISKFSSKYLLDFLRPCKLYYGTFIARAEGKLIQGPQWTQEKPRVTRYERVLNGYQSTIPSNQVVSLSVIHDA